MLGSTAVHQTGAYGQKDVDMFHEQATLLLTEATEAAKDVATRISTAQTLAEPDDSTLSSARSLMHLVQQILEFGVKEEWIHVSHPSRPPFPREASFIARCIASNRGPPTALQMLQALEHRWRGAVCPMDMLPMSTVPATASPAMPADRAVRAYVHAAFNARAVAALLAGLVDAKATVLEDWHYAWSALQRDDIAALLAELERVDALSRGALSLPVEQAPADGGANHVPVGQRVQGFMAKARTVASGVIQHTTAQATAFTQQLRTGRTPAAADPAVELEDSSWTPPRPVDTSATAHAPPTHMHMHSASADAFNGTTAEPGAAAGSLVVHAGAASAPPFSPARVADSAAAAPDEHAGERGPCDLGSGVPARPASPLLGSGSTSPTRFASSFGRPSSTGDFGRNSERQPSLRNSVDGTHSQLQGSGADAAHFSHELPPLSGDDAAGGAVLQGAEPALVSVRVCVPEVVTGATRGQHGEFPIITTAGGHEFRVVRRFRQARTLQQQLRGSYSGGNLDLFLPAAGEQELPPSWAEITKAATAVGSNRTTPATLARRRALLQRCFEDLLSQRPHLLLHAATLDFLGLSRSDVPPGFLRPPSRSAAASPTPQGEHVGGGGGGPASSRHLKMQLEAPPQMLLSDQEVAREQQGMCRGCGRALGALPEEPAADGAAADGPSALRRLSSLRRSMLWILPKADQAERPRRCHFDGWLYCSGCHSGQTAVIPARVVAAWDFRKVPVCDDVHEFLTATRVQPLIRIDADEQAAVIARSPLLRETLLARRRVAQLLGALTVADDVAARDAALRLRFAAGQRVHLLEGEALWSMVDLEDLARGAAFAQVPAWLAKAEEKLRLVLSQRRDS